MLENSHWSNFGSKLKNGIFCIFFKRFIIKCFWKWSKMKNYSAINICAQTPNGLKCTCPIKVQDFFKLYYFMKEAMDKVDFLQSF